MYDAGLKQTQIARHYKMSRNTIKSIIRRSKQCTTGAATTIAQRNGRKPKILTENYERGRT